MNYLANHQTNLENEMKRIYFYIDIHDDEFCNSGMANVHKNYYLIKSEPRILTLSVRSPDYDERFCLELIGMVKRTLQIIRALLKRIGRMK